MKKSGSKLIPSILAAVISALSFIGLAFNFVANSVTTKSLTGATNTTSSAMSLADWNDLLATERNEITKDIVDKLGMWKFSKVLMIITLVVLGIVAVLAIVQLFVDNKLLRLITKIASIAGLILSILFIVFFIIGGFTYASAFNISEYATTTSLPNVGPIIIALAGIVGSIFGLLSNGKKKAK